MQSSKRLTPTIMAPFFPAVPSALSSLSAREAITDTLYRAVVGLDTDNVTLFDSAFTDEAVFDLDGKVFKGFDAIRTNMFDHFSKLDTTHFITNIRIDVKDGASKASGTASSLAQHYRPQTGKEPGATSLLGGSLYYFDCVKDDKDGLWKLLEWKMKVIWADGDYGVITGH